MPKSKKVKIRKAVIPVAGFGTRFLPATIAQPKEMLPIVDKPIIQYIVEEMVAAGIEEIVFVTGRNKRAIEDHFDYSSELETSLTSTGKRSLLKEVHRISKLAKFVYVRQNKMLGSAHAILMAKEVIGDEPFAFAFGDDVFEAKPPAISQIMATYYKTRSTVIGAMAVPDELIPRYGIMKTVGKKRGAATRIAGVGRIMYSYHMLSMDIFLLLLIGIWLGRQKNRQLIIGYLFLSIVFFVWFLPWWWGAPLSATQQRLRQWLPGWQAEQFIP